MHAATLASIVVLHAYWSLAQCVIAAAMTRQCFLARKNFPEEKSCLHQPRDRPAEPEKINTCSWRRYSCLSAFKKKKNERKAYEKESSVRVILSVSFLMAIAYDVTVSRSCGHFMVKKLNSVGRLSLVCLRNLWILLAIFTNTDGVFEFWLDCLALPHLRVLILIS